MALIVKDRVKQTAAAPGTGTVTLGSTPTGFQSFAAVGNTNTTYFAIVDPVSGDWEVNYGVYTSSGTTLTRNATPLSSSNSGSLVNFTGAVDVFVTYPSEKAVYEDTAGVVTFTDNPIFSAGTANGVTYLNGSKVLSSGSALQFNGTNQFTVLAATGTTYNRTESTQYSTFAQHFATSGGTGVEYKTLYRFVDTDAGEIMRLTSTSLYTASGINVGFGTSSTTSYKLNVLAAFSSGIGGAYIEAGEFNQSALIVNHTNAAVAVPLFQVQKSGTGVLTLTSSGTLQKSGTNGVMQLMDGNTAGGVKIGAYTANLLANGYLVFEGYSIEYGRFDNTGALIVGTNAANDWVSYGGISQFRKDQNSSSLLTISNQNSGSSGSAGILLAAYGNSWVQSIGTTAKNGNALTWALDASASPPSEKMRLTTGGNLGVGTNNPGATLDVKGSVNLTNAANSSIFFSKGTSFGYSTSYPVVLIGGTSGSDSTVAIGYDPVINANGAFTGDGNELIFRNGIKFTTPNTANTGWNLKTLVLKDGNVGIGTDNTDPLSLARDRNLAIVSTSTSGALTIIGGNNARIDFGVGSTRTAGIYSDVGNFLEIFTTPALPIVFSPNSTASMRITAAGNLLVGGTSQTAGGEKFLVQNFVDVNSAVAVGIYAGAVGNKDINFYSNGNSQFFTAARIRVKSQAYTDEGNMSFWTTSNNGANVLTDSQKMVILANGNVGINQTVPDFKLDIDSGSANGSGVVTTLRLKNPGTTFGDGARLLFTAGDSTTGGAAIAGYGVALNSADLLFYAGGNTERARFNSTGAFVLAGGTTTANGIGITFPATQSASSDANTLDDYEEGTWSVTDNSGAGLTFTVNYSQYTKIGRAVTINAEINWPSTANTSNVAVSLPIPPNTSARTGMPAFSNVIGEVNFYLDGSANFVLYNDTGTLITNATMSSKYLIVSFTYFV